MCFYCIALSQKSEEKKEIVWSINVTQKEIKLAFKSFKIKATQFCSLPNFDDNA